jgi:anti-sigma regulatory factor (Ser/Thr protein kinase)
MSPLKLEFSSSPTDQSWHDNVQHAFEKLVADCDISGLEGMLLPSAVVEAVNNVIEHAYQNATGKPILLEADRVDGFLVILLRDRGRPMPLPLPAGRLPAADAEGGRGWKIIRSVFPDVHYERIAGENRLRLARPLGNSGRLGGDQVSPSA